jgi:hypothetical protein
MDDSHSRIEPSPSDDMQPQGGPAPHHGPGHEISDVSVRGIFQFAAGLAVFAVALHFTLGMVIKGFSDRANRLEMRRPARFADQVGQFPAPNLQESPSADMRTLRKEEQDDLAQYGWADRKAGIARLPIARAMNLVAAKKGLARRDADAAKKEPEAKKEPGGKSEAKKEAEAKKEPGGKPEAKKEAEAKKEPEAKQESEPK